MRIIAGKHRGRMLIAPPGLKTRPTSDRARQSLFNILDHSRFAADGGSLLPEASVLDVFAGTGAFALEALSRGAARAIAIERDPVAIGAIRDNALKLGELSRLTIRQLDATKPGAAPQAAGLVFLDPPYGQGLLEPALQALSADGWFAAEALIVVELAGKEPFQPPPDFLPLEERRYGKAKLIFLRYRPGHAAAPRA